MVKVIVGNLVNKPLPNKFGQSDETEEGGGARPHNPG